MFTQLDLQQQVLVESSPYYGYQNILVGPHSPSNRHQYPGIPMYAEMFRYLSLLSAPLANKNSRPYRAPQTDVSYSYINSQLNRLYGSVSGPVPPIGLNYQGS